MACIGLISVSLKLEISTESASQPIDIAYLAQSHSTSQEDWQVHAWENLGEPLSNQA